MLINSFINNNFKQILRFICNLQMIATIGSTGTCISDKLNILGPVCRQYNVWLHVDAAYAGKNHINYIFEHYFSGSSYFIKEIKLKLYKIYLLSLCPFKPSYRLQNEFHLEVDTYASMKQHYLHY